MSAGRAASATAGSPAPAWLRRARTDAAYLLSGFPLAIVSFSVLVTCFATGASLLVTLVGLPIVVLTWWVARQFARVERRRIASVTGQPISEPAYRTRTRGGIGALVDAVLDPQGIRDFVHGVGIFAISCVTWTVGVVWAAMAPLVVTWLISGDDSGPDARRVTDWLGIDGHAGRTWFYVGAAVVCVVTLPLVLRGLTALQVAFGRRLLTQPNSALAPGPSRRQLESAGGGRQA